jgi:hypothetical protein
MATHTVGDRKQLHLRHQKKVVFIVGTPDANIGFSGVI